MVTGAVLQTWQWLGPCSAWAHGLSYDHILLQFWCTCSKRRCMQVVWQPKLDTLITLACVMSVGTRASLSSRMSAAQLSLSRHCGTGHASSSRASTAMTLARSTFTRQVAHQLLRGVFVHSVLCVHLLQSRASFFLCTQPPFCVSRTIVAVYGTALWVAAAQQHVTCLHARLHASLPQVLVTCKVR